METAKLSAILNVLIRYDDAPKFATIRWRTLTRSRPGNMDLSRVILKPSLSARAQRTKLIAPIRRRHAGEAASAADGNGKAVGDPECAYSL